MWHWRPCDYPLTFDSIKLRSLWSSIGETGAYNHVFVAFVGGGGEFVVTPLPPLRQQCDNDYMKACRIKTSNCIQVAVTLEAQVGVRYSRCREILPQVTSGRFCFVEKCHNFVVQDTVSGLSLRYKTEIIWEMTQVCPHCAVSAAKGQTRPRKKDCFLFQSKWQLLHAQVVC